MDGLAHVEVNPRCVLLAAQPHRIKFEGPAPGGSTRVSTYVPDLAIRMGEQACAARLDALSSYVAGLDADRGPLAAALIEAALAAEAELRIAAGLPPPARRPRGWVTYPADGPATAPRNATAAPALPPSVARAYAGSYAADDVDLALMGMLRIVRLLRAAATHGEPRGSLLDAFEELAFVLCTRPPPPGAPDDARYVLL